MPDFGTPTIPHQYSHRKAAWFPKGKANTTLSKEDGSKLYYINHFAMTWSRSKLQLYRYVYCPVYSVHKAVLSVHVNKTDL